MLGLLIVASLPYVLAFLISVLEIIKTIIGYILATGLFFCIGFLATQIFEYFTNTFQPEVQHA